MTIVLKPEAEALVQKRMDSGAFESVEDVILDALQSQDAGATWDDRDSTELEARIESAMAEFDNGGGIPASQIREHLRKMKEAVLATERR